METVVLLYNTSCIYEIVTLNYFLHFSGKNVRFASIDGKPITAMEGYSINVDCKLSDINIDDIELFVIPGGNIQEIDIPYVWDFLNKTLAKDAMLTAICAGVDVLDHAGLLNGILSTHSSELDVAVSERIITSRANGYIDFAIEIAKKMNLFKDEEDLRETISFWKNYQRMQ